MLPLRPSHQRIRSTLCFSCADYAADLSLLSAVDRGLHGSARASFGLASEALGRGAALYGGFECLDVGGGGGDARFGAADLAFEVLDVGEALAAEGFVAGEGGGEGGLRVGC